MFKMNAPRQSLSGEALHAKLGDYGLSPYTQVVRYPTGTTDPTASVLPVGVTADGGGLTNLLNATFTPGGTMDTRAKLEARAEFLMMFGNLFAPDGDGRDGNYANYRARYRTYPENDRRNLHVFTPEGLKLRGRGSGTGWANVGDGQVEAACVTFRTKFTKPCIVEWKAKLSAGAGAWPAAWWFPGEIEPYSGSGYPSFRYQDGSNNQGVTYTGKPSFEIDLIDNFGWDGESSKQYAWQINVTHQGDAYHQTDFAWQKNDEGYTYRSDRSQAMQLPFDNSAGMHTYSLEWRADHYTVFRIDGKVCKITKYFTEPAVNSHFMLSNEVGPLFNPQILANLSNQGGVPDGWSFTTEWVRIWSGASNIDITAAPYNITVPPDLPDETINGLTVHNWWNDTGKKLVIDIPDAWDATENTLVVSVTPTGTSVPEVLSLFTTGGSPQDVRFLGDFFGTQGFWAHVGTSDFQEAYSVFGIGGAWSAGVKRTIAVRFKPGDYAYSVNGDAVITSTEPLGATELTKVAFGTTKDNSQPAFTGALKVQHIAGPVSNSQLIILSSQ